MSHHASEVRPPVVLEDVESVACLGLVAGRSEPGPWMVLCEVRNLTMRGVDGIEDRTGHSVAEAVL